MKRTPLARRTPLVARVPWRRKPPMPTSRQAWQAKSRRANPIPPEVRAEVVARSGGRCEGRVAPGCNGRGEHMHHRLRRSQGGGHTAAVLVHLCAPDHRAVHANPEWAYRHGLLVPMGTTEPMPVVAGCSLDCTVDHRTGVRL